MISANCKDILTFWHIMQVCASVCKSVWFYASLCKCERASQKICFRCIFCRSKKNLGLHDLVRNLSHQVGQVELVMSMARLNLVKIWFSQNTFWSSFSLRGIYHGQIYQKTCLRILISIIAPYTVKPLVDICHFWPTGWSCWPIDWFSPIIVLHSFSPSLV